VIEKIVSEEVEKAIEKYVKKKGEILRGRTSS